MPSGVSAELIGLRCAIKQITPRFQKSRSYLLLAWLCHFLFHGVIPSRSLLKLPYPAAVPNHTSATHRVLRKGRRWERVISSLALPFLLSRCDTSSLLLTHLVHNTVL